MRIPKTQRPTFSADGHLDLHAPDSWTALNQEQLRYVLTLMTLFEESVVVKTYMLMRFCGIEVLKKDRFGWQCAIRSKRWARKRFFTMQSWQVESMLGQLAYIDSYEDASVRLERVGGLHAVDVDLLQLRFIDYLNAEKYYQAYMAEQHDRYIEGLALVLYRPKVRWWHRLLRREPRRPTAIHLTEAEKLGTFIWFSYVKSKMASAFPHFFRPASSDGVAGYDLLEGINVQIRALTQGDVTKEQEIYDTPCWRALTELEYKAREAEEINKIRKKHGNT